MSIKESGYNEQYGYPKANTIFSLDHEKYYVSVIGGRHRTAAMIALEYEFMPITISKDKCYLAKANEVGLWYQVKKGLYTKDQALDIFKNMIAIVVKFDVASTN